LTWIVSSGPSDSGFSQLYCYTVCSAIGIIVSTVRLSLTLHIVALMVGAQG